AITDGIDVINYSIGTLASDPWRPGSVSRAFLNARAAGIFVATSGGNNGPGDGSLGSPANAPWITAVGNATHNVLYGNALQNLAGGDTPPPGDLVGAGISEGTGQLVIVHARDYGNALCGTGAPELEAGCDENLGLSNPWAGQRPFNGEIVVCDRGTYGRVEKGKNLLLAGAGGYILANTEADGESLRADQHCLPAVHIGQQDGDELRAWLDSGSGHGGRISGLQLVENDQFADELSPSSSRGPAPAPVQDLMKPNVIAPGQNILAAGETGQTFRELSGTSMSSPHLAGAAALLKSVHPDWQPSQLTSAIETTATAELARDFDSGPVSPMDVGAGRPQLGEAANAGLYLDVTLNDFQSADPDVGGDPRELNLPGLVDADCKGSCSFSRTVTDLVGGGSWTATAEGFPAGVVVSVSPSSFQLANGGKRELSVTVDLSNSSVVGTWVSGRIRLSSAGRPDQFLTVAVLPDGWYIADDRNGGWKKFKLSGFEALPNATFTSGGLVAPETTVNVLQQDDSRDDPFNGGPGVFTKWYELPKGALWMVTETLTSTAEDLDLFVGLDSNDNGSPDSFEVLCESTSPEEVERCDLFDLSPGNYWVVVQNWSATLSQGDQATLVSAAVEESPDSRLAASGPGIVEAGAEFEVRVSWDNLAALPGEEWLGAIGIGSDVARKNDQAVIPVRFVRSGISAPQTFALMDGMDHQLALAANGTHDRLFIDIPPGAGSLTVAAEGATSAQSNGLTLELKRLDFAEGLANPPFTTPAGAAATIASDTGSGGQGPGVSVDNPLPGRWYAVLRNGNASPASIGIRTDVVFDSPPIPIHRGLWEPNSRPGINQGYEYHDGDSSRALIWYTFDEDGLPIWFYSEGPNVDGNIWTADVLRLTNDGSDQQYSPVGKLSVTNLAENDQLFSFTLFGESGTDRLQPLGIPTCPQVNGSVQSYNGQWFRGVPGLGGASIHMNSVTQAQVHFVYDDHGEARWLVAQDLENPEPTNPSMPLLQFTGFCAVCETVPRSFATVGLLERQFASENDGMWTLDYLFNPPLSGSVQRQDSIVKLTATIACP
ncbi:MAG: S8 family serine peptidase, partial [Xanthomonadales bacterium]|nr:S8 family serine peptidase [Xanthomonadales bacterium]